MEDIADEVEETIRGFELEDIQGRLGSCEGDYVEPGDAAWEFLEETLEPFIEDLKGEIEVGNETEALEICKGVALGLYRVRDSDGADLVGWAPDFPIEMATQVIETWHTYKRPNRTEASGTHPNRPQFPKEFIEKFVPEWRDPIAQVLKASK